jgi:hypothetical protein
MQRKRTLRVFLPLVLGLTVGALALAFPGSAHDDEGDSNGAIVEESALLTGLAANSVFPFIDSTPNRIKRAHVAITDSTATCAPGAAAPTNIEIPVGEAGVALVSVMGAGTNTGIGTPRQCVFHVTVRAGRGGVPRKVTDIVVRNKNATAALTGINTVTASAEVD